MERFRSPFGEVELTDEREKHILQHHPELRYWLKHFSKAVQEPEFIRRSKYDPKTLIFYCRIPKYHLAIVIKTNQRNFILTAYLTTKIAHQP